MEKLKFALFSIVVLVLLGLIGYWSVATMQSGPEHVVNEKIKELQKENEEFKKEVEKLKNELSLLQLKDAKQEELKAEIEKPALVITYKYQSLIDDLQKLLDGNIAMKLKSSGTRVGTIQNFLNIYNDTSNKADNDYGAGTEKMVITFQKAEGLTADGEAGPSTFQKMIDWLKKQN